MKHHLLAILVGMGVPAVATYLFSYLFPGDTFRDGFWTGVFCGVAFVVCGRLAMRRAAAASSSAKLEK